MFKDALSSDAGHKALMPGVSVWLRGGSDLGRDPSLLDFGIATISLS